MWLEVLSGEDAGRVVEVDRTLVLGRVAGSDLVIRDARASRRHAELTPANGELRLRDLDSANGTLVDGQPAHEVALQRRRGDPHRRRPHRRAGGAAAGDRRADRRADPEAAPARAGAPVVVGRSAAWSRRARAAGSG